MWPETAEKVRLELAQLRRLIEYYQTLLGKVRVTEPDMIELSALSSFLHSFYTGIESIFKRIASDVDGNLPSGDHWHSGLISAMSQPTLKRHAVISEDLCGRIIKYMGFRHVFRHAYDFELKWRKMSDLVLKSEQVLDHLEVELKAFFEPEIGDRLP